MLNFLIAFCEYVIVWNASPGKQKTLRINLIANLHRNHIYPCCIYSHFNWLLKYKKFFPVLLYCPFVPCKIYELKAILWLFFFSKATVMIAMGVVVEALSGWSTAVNLSVGSLIHTISSLQGWPANRLSMGRMCIFQFCFL